MRTGRDMGARRGRGALVLYALLFEACCLATTGMVLLIFLPGPFIGWLRRMLIAPAEALIPSVAQVLVGAVSLLGSAAGLVYTLIRIRLSDSSAAAKAVLAAICGAATGLLAWTCCFGWPAAVLLCRGACAVWHTYVETARPPRVPPYPPPAREGEPPPED